MEFMDILSQGVAYQYDIKIEKNFKKSNKRELGLVNVSQQNKVKGSPNLQKKVQSEDREPHDNQSKPHAKKGKGKTNKYTRKWCNFHKIPLHNINECHSKKSLVVEFKALE
jgi:hypothetical protein